MSNIPNAFAETLEQTLAKIGIEQVQVAKATGIPAPHLSELKHGKRRPTPEHDLLLGAFFGTSPGFWLRLQQSYDLRLAESRIGAKIAKVKRYLSRNMDSTTSTRCKQVGKRKERQVSPVPSGELLNRGILFNDEMHRIFPSLGYLPRKRVLRFKTLEQADQHNHECLVRAMAKKAKTNGR